MSLSLSAAWLLGGLLGGPNNECGASAEAGARTLQRIADSWPLRLAGDPVRLYVKRLGRAVVAAAEPGSSEEWRFFVVRNLEPTAFAIGGNRFIVSDGLIAFVRNESDLVAVLAHEIAHQRLGHFCGQAPSEAARVRYGSIVQHFDLATERAADAEAVRLLERGGYDPGSMYEVLRCLSERQGAPVSQLRARMRALGRPASSGADSSRRRQGELEEIRNQIVEEAGKPVRRCR